MFVYSFAKRFKGLPNVGEFLIFDENLASISHHQIKEALRLSFGNVYTRYFVSDCDDTNLIGKAGLVVDSFYVKEYLDEFLKKETIKLMEQMKINLPKIKRYLATGKKIDDAVNEFNCFYIRNGSYHDSWWRNTACVDTHQASYCRSVIHGCLLTRYRADITGMMYVISSIHQKKYYGNVDTSAIEKEFLDFLETKTQKKCRNFLR